MPKTEPKPIKRVKHKLEYDTDHGGEIVPAGEIIEITEAQAERIKRAHARRKAEEVEAAGS